MDDIALKLRHDRAVTALLPLFFVSGATALVYQTLWVRELQLVFGTSTFAISTVLAAFMAGLAAGGFLLGRVADRLNYPLATYGVLEIVIGVYAFAFPWIVTWLTPVYLEAYRSLQPGPVMYGLIQFGLVGVALLLPTAMMGGTLPLLARFATQRLGAAGDRVGTLYAVNTFGAVVGTWLCGFVLLTGLRSCVIPVADCALCGIGGRIFKRVSVRPVGTRLDAEADAAGRFAVCKGCGNRHQCALCGKTANVYKWSAERPEGARGPACRSRCGHM